MWNNASGKGDPAKRQQLWEKASPLAWKMKILCDPIMHFPALATRYSWKNIKTASCLKKKTWFRMKKTDRTPSLHPQRLRLGFQQHIQRWHMAHTPLPTEIKICRVPKKSHFPFPEQQTLGWTPLLQQRAAQESPCWRAWIISIICAAQCE